MRRSLDPRCTWYGSGYYDHPDPPADPPKEPPPKKEETPRVPPEKEDENETKPHSHALVIGRFDPPHRGHQYLVDVARGLADEVTVLVRVGVGDTFAPALRLAWCRESFAGAAVRRLEVAPPSAPPAELTFWTHWAAAIAPLARGADVLVSSDPEAWRLGDVLGVRHVLVDPAREAVPVSASAIREDPRAAWDHLPPAVRAHLVRRVCLVGAPGTGKTTLAKALAEALGTAWVPEHARVVAERRGGEIRRADLPSIAEAQRASEEALARRADRVLVCDTDRLQLRVWAERLFGADAPAIPDAPRLPDLYLVTPGDGAFSARCRAAVVASGVPWVALDGAHEVRLAAAIAAIRAL